LFREAEGHQSDERQTVILIRKHNQKETCLIQALSHSKAHAFDKEDKHLLEIKNLLQANLLADPA